MKTDARKHLTDNAWIARIDELKDIVADQYDVNTVGAEEWVEWFVAESEDEFDQDDIAVLLQWARQAVVDQLTWEM